MFVLLKLIGSKKKKSTNIGVFIFICVYAPVQVSMSHNKERRSKRDEKLDKKSQAMEELKAEREKKKNKTGEFDLRPLRTSHFF